MATNGTAAGVWGKRHPMEPTHLQACLRPRPNPDRHYPRLGGTLRRFQSIYYNFHHDGFRAIRSRKESAMCHQKETSSLRLGGQQDVFHYYILNFIVTVFSSFIQERISQVSTEVNIINAISTTQQRKLQSILARFLRVIGPWATKGVNYLASPIIWASRVEKDRSSKKPCGSGAKGPGWQKSKQCKITKSDRKKLYCRWCGGSCRTDSLQ